MYIYTRNTKRINKNTTQFFQTDSGVQQDGLFNPLRFTAIVNETARKIRKECSNTFVGHMQLRANELLCTDDLILRVNTAEELKFNIEREKEHNKTQFQNQHQKNCNNWNEKTKETNRHNIKSEQLKKTKYIKCLSVMVENQGDFEREINNRITNIDRTYRALYIIYFNK